MLVTEEQMKHAVELFAQGTSRSSIAQMLIDEPTDLIQEEINKTGEQDVKQTIAKELRSADPSSSRFAKTKYADLYQTHLQSFRTAMAAHYDQILAGQIKEGRYISAQITDLIEEVKHNLSNAEEPEPTGNGEWNNTIRTLASLIKVQSEHNGRMETLIHRFANPDDK